MYIYIGLKPCKAMSIVKQVSEITIFLLYYPHSFTRFYRFDFFLLREVVFSGTGVEIVDVLGVTTVQQLSEC